METSALGIRMDMPVSLPFSSGMTLPTALAAPVVEGMMFSKQLRLRRQFFLEKASTTFWVAVPAWTVVMRPSMMPNLSLMTLARGARQLVVQEALETTVMLGSYLSRLTPQTNIGVSSLEGPESTTTLAPASRCG